MSADPQSVGYVFPGQGSQVVGMGKDLHEAFPVARDVFAEVDDALGEPLSQLIFEGPKDVLMLTANAQPAIMAVSMAVVEVLEHEAGHKMADARCLAGHSLGEYSALCASGALTVGQTAKLLRIRGEAMQKAVPVGVGAMAALIGATLDQAQAAIDASDESLGTCEIANDNAPGQVVISGVRPRVDQVVRGCGDHGIKLGRLLPVSAPFHCSMMEPAAERMAEALNDVDVQEPCVPIFANVTAEPATDPDAIRENLVRQVTGRVRWVESVRAMVNDSVTKFIELGPGRVLTGLNRRIDGDVSLAAVATPDEVRALSV